MKKMILFLQLMILSFYGFAQQTNFEGSVSYSVEVKSKIKGISDEYMMLLLAASDNTIITIKNGNYLMVSGPFKQYSIMERQKIFTKFRNIDTLYYIDYTDDTTKLIKAEKLKEEKIILNEPCRSMRIETSTGSTKYFYAPALFRDPVYDVNYRIFHYETYSKEAASVWLEQFGEAETHTIHYIATKINKRKVNDSEMKLPDLPQEKFSIGRLRKDPEFTRDGGWNGYISKNINAGLGAKYIKIPKGESEARQSIMMSFLIDATGNVTDVKVTNGKEVHPKLAEEAIRVISESPRWKPATMYGEKIPFTLKQPVTFQAVK